MPVNGFRALHRLAGRLTRRGPAAALILMYHRISTADSDPWSLGVSPQHLADQLAVLRRVAQPVSLDTLCRHLAEGRPLSRQVVVTFDDGYHDNLTQALPLLQRFDVPATVFVASGFVGQAREFWWDELEHLLLYPGRLAPTLQVTLDGEARQWHLDDVAHYRDSDFQRHRAWRAGGDAVPTARHRAYFELHRWLGALDDGLRRRLLDELIDSAGVSPPVARDGYRPLSADELQQLQASGSVSVGAHTRTHPWLDQLPVERQCQDILDGRHDLQALLQRPVTSFAYPYGRCPDEAPGLVQAAGFECACTVEPGTVRAGSHPLRLNRVAVPDCSGDAFEPWLEAWLAGER
jgi:peptidoglycan/xylan/chitin deacetylase (PgdA/CDA1 family)